VKTGPVQVGNVSEYAADGVFDKFAKSEQVVLVREGGRLSACSAICTHKQAILKGVEGQPRCPSHGSRFAPDGSVVKGPAKRSLEHLAISKDASGMLTVDRSKKVEMGDQAASVQVA
jgi:Rieske Fe-S protein